MNSAYDAAPLTVLEVARELRVSPQVVRRYLAAGQLGPAIKVGRAWRIGPTALDRFRAALQGA